LLILFYTIVTSTSYYSNTAIETWFNLIIYQFYFALKFSLWHLTLHVSCTIDITRLLLYYTYILYYCVLIWYIILRRLFYLSTLSILNDIKQNKLISEFIIAWFDRCRTFETLTYLIIGTMFPKVNIALWNDIRLWHVAHSFWVAIQNLWSRLRYSTIESYP